MSTLQLDQGVCGGSGAVGAGGRLHQVQGPAAGDGATVVPRVSQRMGTGSSDALCRVDRGRAAEKYLPGQVVHGAITKLTNFGAFIELEEGIEGLAHISELSWVKRIRHPKEILQIGDQVDVKILAYDVSQGKVSLGFKQVHPNPWSDIDSRFPVGMRMKRKIKNLTVQK